MSLPTQPIVRFPKPKTRTQKLVFVGVGYDPRRWPQLPHGTLPMVVEGGGRYINSAGREDSFFVGGYYGDGATLANGWKPTGEFRQRIVPEKVAQAMAAYPPGTQYNLNVEHWPRGILKSAQDWQIEDTNRRFNAFFAAARSARPDMRFSVYAMFPDAEAVICTNWEYGQRAFAKWQSGEKMTDADWWEASQIADRKPDGTLTLNPERPGYREWLRLQAANTRFTYGLTENGRRAPGMGAVDAVDCITPSCYDNDVGDTSWAYIKWSVSEARRISGGKPVYVFLWMKYAGGAKRYQPIDLDDWRIQCRQAATEADGVILWDTLDPAYIRIAQEEAAHAGK